MLGADAIVHPVLQMEMPRTRRVRCWATIVQSAELGSNSGFSQPVATLVSFAARSDIDRHR